MISFSSKIVNIGIRNELYPVGYSWLPIIIIHTESNTHECESKKIFALGGFMAVLEGDKYTRRPINL